MAKPRSLCSCITYKLSGTKRDIGRRFGGISDAKVSRITSLVQKHLYHQFGRLVRGAISIWHEFVDEDEIDALSPSHQCSGQICKFYKNGLVCSQRVYGDSLQRATLEGVEYTNYPHDAGVIGFVDRS